MSERLTDEEYRAWIDAGSPNELEGWAIILALRARVAKLEAALEDIRDAQWLWHGGRGYTRSEHAEHCEELKEMARAALKDAPQ